MKPYHKPVNTSPEHSFLFKTDRFRYFPTPWHFHPEYDIILVTKSKGMRIIGDHVGSFGPDDLVLIGSGIPHTYINDKKYYSGKDAAAESMVIQFPREVLGEQFLGSPDMKEIADLLDLAARCCSFSGKTSSAVRSSMMGLSGMTGSDRVICLLSILRQMSRDRNKLLLCSRSYRITDSASGFHKLNKALNYISDHFRDELSLAEASARAGMQLQSFCRYFKKHTGKTFSAFVNELRIGYACQQLRQTDKTIAAICFESGFGNLSYFNRQFLIAKKQAPAAFRKLIRQGQHPG